MAHQSSDSNSLLQDQLASEKKYTYRLGGRYVVFSILLLALTLFRFCREKQDEMWHTTT